MIRLAAALVLLLVVTAPGSGEAAANESARLTYSLGLQIAQTFSSVGGLCLADANGGEGDRLTAPMKRDSSPSWSPDGRSVAFRRETSQTSEGIYVQDDRGRIRPVYEVSDGGVFVTVGNPDWSPDGRRILFDETLMCVHGCNPPAPVIYSINPDGSGMKALSPGGPIGDYAPDWSPSGDLIVFTSYDLRLGYSPSIYLMNPDGSNRRLLVRDGYAPSWSPDGNSVVFVRWHEGLQRSNLMIIGADGNAERMLTTGDGAEENPAWSPAGDWIAFEQLPGCGPRCGEGREGTDIALIRPDGTDSHVVRGTSNAELYPAWRPPAPRRPGRQRRCVIRGTSRADTIRGTSRGDLILAGRGRDTVYGKGGNDIIDGGPGRDVVDGGLGFDAAYLGPDRYRSIETYYRR